MIQNHSRYRGIRGHVVHNHLSPDDYKQCLFEDDDDNDDESNRTVTADNARTVVEAISGGERQSTSPAKRVHKVVQSRVADCTNDHQASAESLRSAPHPPEQGGHPRSRAFCFTRRRSIFYIYFL